jgi:hypothetical protein
MVEKEEGSPQWTVCFVTLNEKNSMIQKPENDGFATELEVARIRTEDHSLLSHGRSCTRESFMLHRNAKTANRLVFGNMLLRQVLGQSVGA